MGQSELVLIDTSIWIECLRPSGDEKVRQHVFELISNGLAALNEIVLLELYNGARSRPEKEKINEFEEDLTTLNIDSEVWSIANKLALLSRENGQTVPVADLLVVATAFNYSVSLLHADKHIKYLEQFRSRVH